MTDQSVFTSQTQEPQGEQQAPLAQEQPQVSNTYSDQLAGIVAGDGRQKYETVDKALEALAHSQNFIPTLETKVTEQEGTINQLREELSKHKGVQELVDQLGHHQQQEQPDATPSAAAFGEEQIVSILEATLEKRKLQQTVTTNTQQVDQALTAKYGDKAAQVVQDKAKELGTTPEALGELAKQQPNVVLSLFQASPSPTQITNGSMHMGFNQPKVQELAPPTTSLLSGASGKEQTDYMKQVKADVYRRLGVTE
jgi:predicted FMN-binding regulatory protein PaiB